LYVYYKLISSNTKVSVLQVAAVKYWTDVLQ